MSLLLLALAIARADGVRAPPPDLPPVAPPPELVVGVYRLTGGTPSAPSGAEVRLVERLDAAVASVTVVYETGALRAEGRLLPGALEAIAAALRGDGMGLSGAVADLGGLVEAGCGAGACRVRLTVPPEAVDPAIRHLGERLTEGRIASTSVQRWRRDARAEWRAVPRTPALLHLRAVERAWLPPGARPTSDREARDFGQTSATVRAAWQRLRAEARVRVDVVGPVSLEGVLPSLEQAFGAASGRSGGAPPGWDLSVSRAIEVDDPGSADARVTLAWAAPAATDPGGAAWSLVAHALFDGPTSRLRLALRENLGLGYDLAGEQVEADGQGLDRVDLVVPVERLDETLAALAETLAAMAADGPSDGELARARAWAWHHARSHPAAPGERSGVAMVRDVSVSDARLEARRWLAGPRVLVVTGDGPRVEAALGASGYAEVWRWDACFAAYGGACP